MEVVALIKDSHLSKTNRRACIDPCPGEVHHLHLIRCKENVRLTMGNGDHVFSVTLDVVGFDILTRPLVKEVLQVRVLVGDGASHGPYGISQANRWALGRRSVSQLVSL